MLKYKIIKKANLSALDNVSSMKLASKNFYGNVYMNMVFHLKLSLILSQFSLEQVINKFYLNGFVRVLADLLIGKNFFGIACMCVVFRLIRKFNNWIKLLINNFSNTRVNPLMPFEVRQITKQNFAMITFKCFFTCCWTHFQMLERKCAW